MNNIEFYIRHVGGGEDIYQYIKIMVAQLCNHLKKPFDSRSAGRVFKLIKKHRKLCVSEASSGWIPLSCISLHQG